MFDLPLHPIVVHFPIVLGALLPFLAILLVWAIKKWQLPSKVWMLVSAVALVYTLSATGAVLLGEEDEEKVEKVVSERVIEEHEEAGELIPWIAGTLFLVSLGGLSTRYSKQAQMGLIVLSLVAVAPLINAGHTGGELVYEHGAAFAHLPPDHKAAIQSGTILELHEKGDHEHGEKDDDDDHDKDD
ncbi:MAG: hypothetical protein OEZ51_05375 [Nitrospinota bacterium]|nr:hypothetical protein [Nitrospinota bacterium]